MHPARAIIVFAGFAARSLILVAPAAAQGNPPGTTSGSVAVSSTQSLRSDLAAGGDTQWSQVSLSAGVTHQFVPAFWGGISARYGSDDWRFHSPSAFGGEKPWRTIDRPAAALHMNLALSKTLVIGVSPTLEWAYESGTNSGDALIYGSVFSMAKAISERLLVGGGASVTRQFYNVKTSPFVILNWKLTERLRIANAIGAGPLGGAGVELRYVPAPAWELAAGGVNRSDRFRLQDHGRFASQVGETSCIPLLLRVSRNLDAKSRFDLYAGALVAGTLKIKDSDGRDLAKEDYHTAPAISGTLSRKF